MKDEDQNSNYWIGGTSYNSNSAKKVSSVRSLIGTKDNLFQRRHYEFLAKAIGEFDTPNHSNLTDYMIKHFSDLLAQDNPRFDTKRFREKVNFIKEGKWPDLYG